MTITELHSPSNAPSESLEPPAALEDRVVQALREEGLLTSIATQERAMKRIHVTWGIAATILLVAGLALGRSWPEGAVPVDDRPQFALMLYEDASYQIAPAGEDRVGEYGKWARSLAQRGYLVDGAKLSEKGVVLAQAGTLAESVPTSDQGVLAGYFVIRAANRDEAERLARECPHLKYQGTISLRAIEV